MIDFSETRNKVVALIGAGACLVCLSLYLREVERDSLETGTGTPIGHVTYTVDDVQRRPRQKRVWLPLPTAKNVFERDVIRTGARSLTRIDLGSYGTIEIKADSLVVLETQGDGLHVNLAAGDMLVRGNISAQVGDSQIQAQNGSYAVSKDARSGQVEVQSQSGQVRVSSNGQNAQLAAGELLRQGQDGALRVQDMAIERKLPADDAVIEGTPIAQNAGVNSNSNSNYAIKQRAPRALVNFAVAARAGADLHGRTLALEVSTERNFRGAVQTVPWPVANAEISQALGEGKFFWRVRDLRTHETLSTVGSFELRLPPRLAWSDLPPEKSYLLKVGNEGLGLRAGWLPVRAASRYALRIVRAPAKDSADQPTVLGNFDLGVPRIDLDPTQTPGDRSPMRDTWQQLRTRKDLVGAALALELDALDASGRPLTAQPLRAPLRLQDTQRLVAPQNFAVQLNEKFLTARLRWEGVADAKEYLIDWNGEQFRTAQTQYELPAEKVFALGPNAHPTVAAISLRDLPGASAPLQPFDRARFALASLVAQSPRPLSPSRDSTLIRRDNPRLAFAWKLEGNAHYQPVSFELTVNATAQSGSPKPTVVKVGAVSRADIALPPDGAYTWTVRAFWPGDLAGAPSRAQSFRVTLGAAIDAPRLRAPASVSGSGAASSAEAKP